MDIGWSILELKFYMKVDPKNPKENNKKKVYNWFNFRAHRKPQSSV